MFYKTVDFDFSEKSKKLLLNYFNKTFKSYFPHAEAIEEESPYKKWAWCHSSVGKELEIYLKQYHLNLDFYGINFFISNTAEYYIGNPHIDAIADSRIENIDLYKHTKNTEIVSRFSVMILGNPKDSIYWWNELGFGDSRLVVNKFTYLNNEDYFSLNIPGSTTAERWNYLGQPSFVADNVWSPSAFIKTNCAHTVNCSAGPRLMVTVPLKKSIDEIFI